MATDIDQALFEDELSPGYNSFNEALANAVAAAMRKRREEGRAKTEPPKDGGGDEGTEEKAEEASASEEVAEAAQESPEQGELGLDDGETVEGEVESEEKEEAKKDSGKIEDFGEKLGGARKDLYQRYREMFLKVTEDELSKYPLAKLWPQPNYKKLLDEGVEPWRVVMLRVLREDLGKRPPTSSYKVHRWNRKFLYNRSVAEEVLDVENNANEFADYMGFYNSNFSDATICKAYMYLELGADTSEKEFPYTFRYFSELERAYINGEPYSGCYILMEHVWKPVEAFNTHAEAQEAMIAANMSIIEEKRRFMEEALRQIAGEQGKDAATGEVKRKYDKFSVLGWQGAKGYWFIGKKYNGEWLEVKKPFEDAKAAREYLESHKDEIQDLFEQFKFVPSLRRTETLPRTETGNPARMKDITPEEFSEAFGFRGVEFGNWVEDKKRQQDLNEAYDGLMDLAGVLNVPPKALSLCGELGLRFGSNGRGGKNAAKAHYEPDLIAINLTKKAGAGSLAHEWFHAMDHYFNRHVGQNENSFLLLTETRDIERLKSNEATMQTVLENNKDRPDRQEFIQNRYDHYNSFRNGIYENSEIRREVLDKFVGLLSAFEKETPDVSKTYLKRSEGMDRYHSKPYWSKKVEMAARAFEAYVYTKLEEKGIRNDYLVNYLTPKEYDEVSAKNPARLSGKYPYPVPEEMPVIKKAYDDLFETIETREAEDGKVELYSSSDYRRSRLEQCETVFDEELSEAQLDLKAFASAVLEQDVEFFEGPETFHGSYDPLENKILLNINSEKPMDWVLWHECFHAFGALEPETYKELTDYMDANAPITREQIEAYKESVKGYDLPDNVVKQELMADAFADMKKRQATMEQMKDKAPGLFGRVSGYFSRVKDKAKEFFFGKEDVKLTKKQFEVFEQGIKDIEKLRVKADQRFIDDYFPERNGYDEEIERDLRERDIYFESHSSKAVAPHTNPILEGRNAASLETVMKVAQRCEDRNRNRLEGAYGNEKQGVQKRLKIIDFTPLQQKDFDVQFAKDAIRDGARPRDVEYVLKKASPLGQSKRAVSEIMREAKAIYAR